VHTAINALVLRRLVPSASVREHVSILLPLRNEAARAESCVSSLIGQQGLDQVELLCYDDDSSDDTVQRVESMAGGLLQWVPTRPLPAGWLGKSHACATLAEAAAGDVFVFVDADVVLQPDAIARAVATMRAHGLGFVAPYPRQLTAGWLSRLTQPLLTWSWLAFLPLRAAERSSRPSLVAANGQFLVVDAAFYRACGGHHAVSDAVVEDVALARRLRATGARGGFVSGREVAACRMYDDNPSVVDGYAKSLWAAFGSPSGAVGVSALLLALAVLPWILIAVTGWLALPGALAGPVSRLVAARVSGSRPYVDAFAHPLSVIAFVVLVGISIARRRSGRLVWRERRLP
jgi:glycosyltransferase involved in cell wall biosynthesis